MEKSTKKRIIIAIFILLIIAGKITYDHFKEKEQNRLAQEAYFTEAELSEEIYYSAIRNFWLYSTPHWATPLDKDKWPDFSYYVFESSETTEVVVELLNYRLFVEGSPATELAESYGLTEDNLMTSEWVVQNPMEALDICWEDKEFYNASYGTLMKHYNEYRNSMEGKAVEKSNEESE